VPAHAHIWYDGQRTHGDNPWPGFLALADRFIVTADSTSMLAEACASGRPVRGSRLAALYAPLLQVPAVPRLHLQGVE